MLFLLRRTVSEFLSYPLFFQQQIFIIICKEFSSFPYSADGIKGEQAPPFHITMQYMFFVDLIKMITYIEVVLTFVIRFSGFGQIIQKSSTAAAAATTIN